MEKEIFEGKICPYCRQKTSFVDSSVIYGKSYGMIYICFECDAYVGCHKGTDQAKGSLANQYLRELRKKAHSFFDPLWKAKMKRDNCSKNDARNAAYDWLSKQLGTPRYRTHIGMFNEEQCQQVIEICSTYYRNITK
ncbi:MAG: zinc-finger-containing protein [Halothece sp.]